MSWNREWASLHKVKFFLVQVKLYWIIESEYHILMAFFIFLCFCPDYLNNLSPDSKEYEDTQGKPH